MSVAITKRRVAIAVVRLRPTVKRGWTMGRAESTTNASSAHMTAAAHVPAATAMLGQRGRCKRQQDHHKESDVLFHVRLRHDPRHGRTPRQIRPAKGWARKAPMYGRVAARP